jgi:hypothetical protein
VLIGAHVPALLVQEPVVAPLQGHDARRQGQVRSLAMNRPQVTVLELPRGEVHEGVGAALGAISRVAVH